MRRAEVVNPVILLDEVDKLGQDFRGDPAAALLEVLDPEQNTTFNDNYLEVDYDLSQVLFITTANSLAGIPEPLRDRMEILRIAGYLDHEKLAIARQYLLPRQIEANGLEEAGSRARARRADGDHARLHARGRRARAGAAHRARGEKAGAQARRDGVTARWATTQTVRVEDLQGAARRAPFDPDDTSLEDKVGVASGLAYTSASAARCWRSRSAS